MTIFYFMLIAAYLIGAIPTGVVLTRMFGSTDIRNSGSGNIGATNVYRVAGKKLGILTLIGDALKGAVPVLIAMYLLGLTEAQVGAVAAVAFIGHCYPVYLGFKGGKGVATALGIFWFYPPWPFSALLSSLPCYYGSGATSPWVPSLRQLQFQFWYT